jgi:hypothetical protein
MKVNKLEVLEQKGYKVGKLCVFWQDDFNRREHCTQGELRCKCDRGGDPINCRLVWDDILAGREMPHA